MLAEFATWWVEQMRSLVPGGGAGTGRPADALIIALDSLPDLDPPDAAISGSLLLRRGGLETPLGPINPNTPYAADPRLAAGLRLPPGEVLCREVALPLAAARDLETVIGFELDQLTPFAADELYWGIGAATPDRARGKLRVKIFLVPRAPVDRFRRALAALRIIPTFVEAPGGRIDLKATHSRSNRLLQTGLAGLCAALALACLATPFLRQQIALDATAQFIAAHEPAAQTALALRQQLATAASGRTAIAQARRAGDALEVLATLTTALPDGTWLNDLTLNSGDLTFDGQSTDAARLIGLLSDVPGLQDPSFTAPVTRTADGRSDQFSMHATVGE